MTHATRYDSQAAVYDRRAGLPDDAVGPIAQAVFDLVRASAGGLLLEIGTGTGQIGYALQALPVRYVGFDLSAPMLEQFRQRFPPEAPVPALLRADGNERWPVDDGSVGMAFSSRAVHLLDRRHAVDEFFRVASPRGAVLALGRVRRDPEGVKERMRRQMRRLLREQGVDGAGREGLLDECVARGAEALPARVVASWRTTATPAQSLESWESKDGLAGRDVRESVKQAVLASLRRWAAAAYGDLQSPSASDESYILECVRIPPRGES